MDTDYRPSQIQNATILLIFGGIFHLYLGYTMFQLSVMSPGSFQTIIGTIMVAIGILTFCTSLLVWFQSPWATKIIAVVGITACASSVALGYFLIIIIIAPLYWYAIKWIRTNSPSKLLDWDEE